MSLANQAPTLLLQGLKLRTVIALLIVVAFFAISAPNFLTIANIVLMAKHIALNAFLAIGLTFVIIGGGIDLSVGSIVGLCGMIAGFLLLNGVDLPFGYTIYFNLIEIVLITLLLGTLIGAANGALVTRFKVAPFIATLGTLYVVRGMAMLKSNGATYPNLVGTPELGTSGFPALGAGDVFGIPISVWLLIIVAAIAAYVARRTPVGRHVYAVGGNAQAAALSGVRVGRVVTYTYMFSGFCAAMVGLIIASELQAAHPATGTTFELNAIAAAVLGGASMSGGRGTVWGTLVGAMVIGVLSDGMVMMGVSAFWQMVIKGVVIVAAVMLDQAQRDLQRSVALRQAAQGAA